MKKVLSALVFLALLAGCSAQPGGEKYAENQNFAWSVSLNAPECYDGGLTVTFGPDSDADKTLDSSEARNSLSFCDQSGQKAVAEVSEIPPGEDCPGGGVLLESGIDLDGDSALDFGERDFNRKFCYGDPADADNDAYSTLDFSQKPLDCDDNDSSVHPGAVETCDGKDNDCDSLVDEGPDSDGDRTASCCDPDDSDAEIYPGATELCDGKDNDGDGTKDEGFDADGDSYASCFDCDDADWARHPGAPDATRNGIDEDCSGGDGPPVIDLDSDGADDDFADNCKGVFNPSQADADSDGAGDACDNCPAVQNAGQEDAGGDGIGDACDRCLLGLQNCGDLNPCTSESCVSTAPGLAECITSYLETSCDDNNPCTVNDACGGGLCAGAEGILCDDGNLLTLDSCTPLTGECVNTPPDCGDLSPCTNDGWSETLGVCVNEPLVCDDLNPLTADSCAPDTGECVFTPPECGDLNPCTADSWSPEAGICLNAPVVCDDLNPLTTDSCDSLEGKCVFIPPACGDDNPCTEDSWSAQAGQCVFEPAVCDDLNVLTTDSCDPLAGGCVFTPPDCGDDNPCTEDSWSASEGICLHTAASCDDANACTLDGCSPETGCYHTQVTCDDGVYCTSDYCLTTQGCRAIANGGLCYDGSIDTIDTCSPLDSLADAKGCVHTPVITQACSDSSECTGEGEFCLKPDGQCAGAGTCTSFLVACIQSVDPVCGCDGITYPNYCTAVQSGVSIAYMGVCQIDTVRPVKAE
ncbi:hypothetical protein EPN96_02390 [bacterium]|nr:MAG: hypothetical protein EPN96_02390 [bacterium]